MTRQWTDADGRYPLENSRHIRDDQVLTERNPITVRSIALQTALSGLSRIVFCNCRDSDVGIIDEFRINNGTVSERFRQKTVRNRQDLDAIWTQSAEKQLWKITPDHSRFTGHRPEYTRHCSEFDPIQQNLSRHSHDCNPTRQNRLSCHECYGTHLTVGVLCRTIRTLPDP